VSVTLSHRLCCSLISSHFLSEFIGELKDQFQRPLVVKYSDKVDSPVQSLAKKLDNNIGIKQHLKLTRNGLLVGLEPMQFHILMWCRIFQEGSSLNIEIHKHFQRLRILRFKRASQDDLLCKASIKFDDIWGHLVLETQRGTNCELMFALIISHLLRAP